MNTYKRFIPAGAGNTMSAFTMINSNTVYPRWRGEHAEALNGKFRADGLSPLARGTPVGQLLWSYARRFIPAGAGNTTRYRRLGYTYPVYPRWRGEHSKNNLLFSLNFYRPQHSTNIYFTTHLVKERLPC